MKKLFAYLETKLNNWIERKVKNRQPIKYSFKEN
jgi:hypothetical protein